MLFDDRGFDGLVLVNELSFLDGDIPQAFPKNGSKAGGNSDGDGGGVGDGGRKLRVRVGSGYPFNTLGQLLSSAGWGGLEFATGIPGTVGGAIFMNAGANGRETRESLVSVEYVPFPLSPSLSLPLSLFDK